MCTPCEFGRGVEPSAFSGARRRDRETSDKPGKIVARRGTVRLSNTLPAGPRSVARHAAILSLVGALVLAVALSVLSSALIKSENPGHAADHLSLAIPALLLAFALARLCPRPKPTRIARLARRAVIIGLVFLGASLALEALGAFGYQGDESKIEALTTLHNATFVLQLPGALILLIGGALAALSLPQRRAPG